MEEDRRTTPRLWQGGPWEHPAAPVCPPVLESIPSRGRGTTPAVGPRGRSRHIWFGFAIFLVLIAGLTVSAVYLSLFGMPDAVLSLLPDQSYADAFEQQPVSQETTIPRAETGGTATMELVQLGGETLTLQEIYEKNIPSIVYIQARQQNGTSAGSGVVLSADGYILTNEHVIAGASYAEVILYDNTILEARLVGYNTANDLAVLKVEAEDLVPAEFGNSGQLQVGDRVVAIGNPLGSTLRGTMTEGIVSAIDRNVEVEGTTMSLIQTTAALNSGNSGGALINDRGQVVGITTLKMMSEYETIEGLGFAIPTRFAKGIVDQLIATGQASTPALGITVVVDVAQYGGLLVREVAPNSDAWDKGLRAEDIIVAANGVPITDNNTLNVIKEPMRVGDTITLTVRRGEETLEFEIVLMDSELF